MSDNQNVLLLNLLDILRRHTDENHPITQKQLLSILEETYDLPVARRTVKMNMEKLVRYYERESYGKIEFRVQERQHGKEEEVYDDIPTFIMSMFLLMVNFVCSLTVSCSPGKSRRDSEKN